MTYDLAGDIARALDAQDVDRSKFAVGETVYIRNQPETITDVQTISGEHYYQVKQWAAGWWLETLLTSVEDWQESVAQYMADTEARAQQDADMAQHLADITPVRALYESDADFEWAYVQWAESFWGCGNMPEPVRRLYNRYMLANRWTVLS